MAKRFETTDDLNREDRAIEVFTSRYGYSSEKLGKWDLDFKIYSDDVFIGYAEVKGRNRLLSDDKDFPLANRKVKKMMACDGAKIIIWASLDGITYGQLDRLQGKFVRNGGRNPREGSCNDMEEMFYYNMETNNKVLTSIKYK